MNRGNASKGMKKKGPQHEYFDTNDSALDLMSNFSNSPFNSTISEEDKVSKMKHVCFVRDIRR